MWGLGQAGVGTCLEGTGEPWIVLIPGRGWQASRKTGALCPEQPLELEKAPFINEVWLRCQEQDPHRGEDFGGSNTMNIPQLPPQSHPR